MENWGGRKNVHKGKARETARGGREKGGRGEGEGREEGKENRERRVGEKKYYTNKKERNRSENGFKLG